MSEWILYSEGKPSFLLHADDELSDFMVKLTNTNVDDGGFYQKRKSNGEVLTGKNLTYLSVPPELKNSPLKPFGKIGEWGRDTAKRQYYATVTLFIPGSSEIFPEYICPSDGVFDSELLADWGIWDRDQTGYRFMNKKVYGYTVEKCIERSQQTINEALVKLKEIAEFNLKPFPGDMMVTIESI